MIKTREGSRKGFVLSREDQRLLEQMRQAMGRKAPERWAEEATAAGIKGASGATLRRLRAEDPTRLTDTVRVMMEAFLEWRGVARTPHEFSRETGDAGASHSTSRALDLIERATTQHVIKVLKDASTGELTLADSRTVMRWAADQLQVRQNLEAGQLNADIRERTDQSPPEPDQSAAEDASA